jgi:ABC-2 type transport system permease protein
MKSLLHAWVAEYRSIFTDPGVILLMVGSVVFYSFFYPLPYRNEVLRDIPVAVVDADASQLSRKLIRMLDATENIGVISKPTDFEAARAAFFHRDIFGIVVIPENFSRKILAGAQARIAVYADAGYFFVYRQTLKGALQAVGTLAAQIEVRRMTGQGIPMAQAISRRDPVPALMRPLFNPSGGYASYVVPAVFILVLQQTLLLGIGMRYGTDVEFAAPVATLQGTLATLLGRAGAYLSIYLVNAAYYLWIVPRMYTYPGHGNLVHLLMFTVPFLLSVIFLGQWIALFFNRRETSMMVLVFTSVPILFLAGFSWPSEAMPAGLRFFSLFLPSTAGIEGLLKLNQMGATLADVKFYWGVLWGLAAVYFVMACIFAYRMRTTGVVAKGCQQTMNGSGRHR